MKYKWIDVAKRLQAIAQAGLTFTEGKYDLERYKELRDISVQIMSDFTDSDMSMVRSLFASETGYQTPKVDVRGVVFNDDKILMVRETIDNRWSLPGGWADVGFTPKEMAVKEVWEETGYHVEPVRLLAVLDKKTHPHPPDMYHVYKIFILCEITGGEKSTSIETSEVDFFAQDQLPELSEERNTASQINLMFEFLYNKDKEVVID